MDSLIEKRTYKHHTIEIHYDQNSGGSSPRDWDNGTTLCLTHKRYTLPNEGNIPFDDLDSMADVIAYVKAHFSVLGDVYPVSMTDHSGTSYYLGSPADPWDSGYVGVIFATTEGQETCGYRIEDIPEILKGDLETFTQWANGSVYGFVIKGPDGKEIADGSLWDMYDSSHDFSYIVENAKGVIDAATRDMTYYVIERGPRERGGTRQVHVFDETFDDLDTAIAFAKEKLASLTPELIETGWTVIIEDTDGRVQWGVDQ